MVDLGFYQQWSLLPYVRNEVFRMRPNPTVARLLAVTLAGALLLTGCTGASASPAQIADGTFRAPAGAHSELPVETASARAALSVTPLPRTGWTVTASDQETTSDNGAVADVLDGSTSTYWHSKWSGAAVPLPHSITIDMHKTDTVAALKYL